MTVGECRAPLLAALAVVCVLGAGCDQDGEPILVLVVEPAEASLAVGEELQLDAALVADDGAREDVTTAVTWTSSDDAVAVIDQRGLATARRVGETTLRATLGSRSTTARLSVEEPSVVEPTLERCAVEPGSLELGCGATGRVSVMGSFSDGSTRVVTDQASFTSSDESVARVSGSGEVAAVGVGEAELGASLGDVDCEAADVLVLGEVCDELTVTAQADTLMVGDTVQLRASCRIGEDEVDVTDVVSWASDDERVATVDDHGEAEGVGLGAALITASFENPDGTRAEGTLALEVVPPALVEIYISPVIETFNDWSEPVQYEATCTNEDSTTSDCTEEVTWRSSDPDVATIDAQGLAWAVDGGTTEITASLDGVTSNTAVLIVDEGPNDCVSLSISPTDPNIPIGVTVRFSVSCVRRDGMIDDDPFGVTWESSDETVATIDADGVAMGLEAGETDITATVATSSGPLSSDFSVLTVVDADPLSIIIEPNPLMLSCGPPEQLTATLLWNDGAVTDATADVAWSSSSPAIATVSNEPGHEGEARGLAIGTATITATLSGLTGTAAVVVHCDVCESVVVEPNPLDLLVGEEARLTATCLNVDGTATDVTTTSTWASSAPEVATVGSASPDQGLVTGVAAGSATISASFRNGLGVDLVGAAAVTVATP